MITINNFWQACELQNEANCFLYRMKNGGYLLTKHATSANYVLVAKPNFLEA